MAPAAAAAAAVTVSAADASTRPSRDRRATDGGGSDRRKPPPRHAARYRAALALHDWGWYVGLGAFLVVVAPLLAVFALALGMSKSVADALRTRVFGGAF